MSHPLDHMDCAHYMLHPIPFHPVEHLSTNSMGPSAIEAEAEDQKKKTRQAGYP
ncbi:hypothetical protein PAXINDRAFT_20391 [Paxillus involutus ATCC 200175]|uniref:Uncharacterized protein n=1 Tax=Paxillus involutus ATCC 200175 TaxID=664439 RepID=A0A0C9SV20_PAXIN|nr:hypothetical protein PAXINDRAFT_20391 [Paxillus involutus ATCC 200175]